ncbi:Crp/Fnr family transcriptional regulator [Sphingomonas parva]|uniref:Crp/Fnr family transcriptional regulator n=1 Tax=Sphingomonas parva TaxID=2555898 RepID=A0A4Y8ZYP4_9SPHN|nr:Crp/Fnr family transcriptional regulator [Sphingomonas parva]TFI60119.1 Crp/Fnr family transcriptional regulator [Sphingomonas parva]
MIKNGAARADGDAAKVNFAGNRLLATFSPAERALLTGAALPVSLRKGEILWQPGEAIPASYFPCAGTQISLAVDLADGARVDVATIGKEGAAGGIVSCGTAHAFGTASVQVGGAAIRVDLAELEAAKARSAHIKSLFCRYSDALLAQVMQSVACNASHALEARLCRWLLSSHDRAAGDDIPVTQGVLAEMLGVQRTTTNMVLKTLSNSGAVELKRGTIRVLSRATLEELACECYRVVEEHFARVLPPLKPQQVVPDDEA